MTGCKKIPFYFWIKISIMVAEIHETFVIFILGCTIIKKILNFLMCWQFCLTYSQSLLITSYANAVSCIKPPDIKLNNFSWGIFDVYITAGWIFHWLLFQLNDWISPCMTYWSFSVKSNIIMHVSESKFSF